MRLIIKKNPINLIIILVLLVAIVALGPIFAKFVFAASSTVSGMQLNYSLSPNLSVGQTCTANDDTKCNGTFTCKQGPNTATFYCINATHRECGESGGDGFDTGDESGNSECQSDGTWACNGGFWNKSETCTQTVAGFFSGEDVNAQTACPYTGNGDIFDTSSAAGAGVVSDCTSCLYNGSGSWKVNATENCITNVNYNLGNNNFFLVNSSFQGGNFTVAFNLTGIGNWSVCRGCRIVIRENMTFG